MRLKSILSCIIAAALGIAVAVVIKIGYSLPGVLPTSDLFISVITSGLAREWMAATHGKAGILIAVLIRAFPWSITTGFGMGVVLHRFKYPRVFCYSVLVLPLLSMITGYLSLSQPLSQQVTLEAQRIYLQLWVNFSVLIWFFTALYLGKLLARRAATFGSAHCRREEATTQQAATGP